MIGEVTDTRPFRILRDGEVVGEIPVPLLVDDCPLYDLEPEAPTTPLYGGGVQRLAAEATAAETLMALLASANIASRRPVFEQYDPVVQSRTVRRPEQADAAVLALPCSRPHRPGRADPGDRRLDRRQRPPRRGRPAAGAAEVVYECAANLACTGAEPLGLTNCLNFGNPEKPHVAWQLSEAVDGLAQACRDLERAGRRRQRLAVQRIARRSDPADAGDRHGRQTPRRAPRRARSVSLQPGDKIALVGEFNPSRDGSEIAKLHGSAPAGALPAKDVSAIREAQCGSARASATRSFSNAHDIAEGGIAVALAECCIHGWLGATITLPEGLDPFGEDFGTAFLVSGSAEALAGLYRDRRGRRS